MVDFQTLLDEIRGCAVCAQALPLGPRPVLVAKPSARLLIIGQAPGTKVHESGIPWNDRSGDRLRDWLALDQGRFYDPSLVAILPMGLCYPGVLPRGGDAPPRPECAPLWHDKVLAHLPNISLTLLVGSYAQAHYLERRRKRTLTETVRTWREYGTSVIPLPHPSWRTTGLARKNPWFEADLLPDLRARVARVLSS